MSREQAASTNQAQRPSHHLLAIAVASLIFANGRWILSFAGWSAPVFMLRFLRTRRTKGTLLLSYLGCVVAVVIAWRGMIPLPAPLFFMPIALAVGMLFFLPYLMDRLLAHRFEGFTATLVFPVAWVAVEYVYYSLNPVGQWGLIAYSQARNLSLLQVTSITGIWGITFLIAWFASTVNWAWEHGFEWKSIRRGVAIYAGVLSAVLLFGQARMVLFPPASPTVRVGSVTATPEEGTRSYFAMVADDTNEDLQKNQGEVLRIQNTLLELSRREARAGAKIVFWAEANALVHANHEDAFVERGRALAREEQVVLLMPLYTIHPGEHPPENKIVTIDSDGSVRSIYHKEKVAVEASEPGDGIMPTLATPYGTITSAICVDFSYPDYIRQAGRAGADIALDPSWDWKEVDPYHTWVSAVRAVENGFSMVRQTNDGLSATIDYHGRVLARMDHFTTKERVMISEVPTQGVTTIYSVVGDLFAWICIIAFVIMIGSATFRSRGPSEQVR